MSALTKLSVGLNIGFIGVAVLLIDSRRLAREPATGGTIPAKPSVHSEPRSAALPGETQGRVINDPFQWSRLESADYRTYIANLRGVGCPEQTIRDIITADIDAGHYTERRQQLEKELFSDVAWRRNPASCRTAATELSRLKGEEASIVSSLMGTDRATTQDHTNSWTPTFGNIMAQFPARLPLAFQEVSPGAIAFSPQELELIESIQQAFKDEIGEPQDPSDPAYLRRWQVAQRGADYSLRDILGQRRYDELEEQVQEHAAARQAQQ